MRKTSRTQQHNQQQNQGCIANMFMVDVKSALHLRQCCDQPIRYRNENFLQRIDLKNSEEMKLDLGS